MKEEVSPKSRNPPTSRKRMRRLGEPQRKMLKLEKHQSDEHPPANADGPGRNQQTIGSERKGLTDEPRRENGAQKKLRKVKNREKREQKTKARKEREAAKAKKKTEREEKLRNKGEMLTRNQPKISGWFRKEGAGSKRTPTGGKTGVG